jgi:hypothetical protein
MGDVGVVGIEYTLATWVYVLHTLGIAGVDARVAQACDAVDAATDATAGNAAAEALVARIGELLAGADSPEAVKSAARALYGDGVDGDLGVGGRDQRIQRIRAYQFGRNLPWLARIWERHDGVVSPSWLLVERMTDEVAVMDANPWNDIDEKRRLPVDDFVVLWELDGCTSLSIR